MRSHQITRAATHLLVVAGMWIAGGSCFGQSLLIEAYLDSADSARESSQIAKASRLYALALKEAHAQEHPLLLGRALLGAAAVHIERNELQQAEENVRAALGIYDAIPSPPRQPLAMALNLLAMGYFHDHKYEQAEACYVKLLKDMDTSGPDPIVRGVVLNDLALVKIALGDHDDAADLAAASAVIVESICGDDSVEYANCLNTLAQVYHAATRLDEAEEFCAAGLRICLAATGDKSPQYGRALLTLGKIQHGRGEHLESVKSVEAALQLHEIHHGADHPLVHHARAVHRELLSTLPPTTDVAEPNADEAAMFDEMYSGAGLTADELAGLRDHWHQMSGAERLSHYIDFHATVAAHRANYAPHEQSPASTATTDDEAAFHLLFGRHALPAAELQERREHWNRLTSQERQLAIDLYRKSQRTEK